jgi:hypothetical protein
MAVTTWKDIKLATLQKMFSSNGQTIQADTSTQEYINSMPQAANEGLQLLATAGKFIIKKYVINNYPCQNLLGFDFSVSNRRIADRISFNADNVHSYYFQVCGTGVKCTITIDAQDEASEPVVIDIHTPDDEDGTEHQNIDSNGYYETFKGNLVNPNGKKVTIDFECPYPFNIADICFYKEQFSTDADVPDYSEYLKFDLKALIPDFYQLSENDIYFEDNKEPRYLVASNYYQEADNVLIIPRTDKGVYTIWYKAYPGKIDFATPDDYDMCLDPEVAAILPLYMASELYKDDDNAIATVYRNEFEVAREALSQKANVSKREQFVSESGWS